MKTRKEDIMEEVCKTYSILKNKLQDLSIGFGSSFFKDVIAPSWWDSCKMQNNESLCLQLALHISKKLRISAKSLVVEGKLKPVSSNVKFKLPANKTADDVQYSTSLLVSLAEIIPIGLEQNITYSSAWDLRNTILKHNRTVNLYSLLDCCWDMHIPVLHVTNFPTHSNAGWSKPTAVTIRNNNKYVIFLCKNNFLEAQFLFELAHEIGHIMQKHLNEGEILVDSDDNFALSDSLKQEQKQEQEANRFASELLGSYDFPINNTYKPEYLAKNAIKDGKEFQIDPSHLALYFAYKLNCMSSGIAAVKLINQKKGKDEKPIELINQKAFAALDIEDMKLDDANFLCKLTGIMQEPVK